jgi:hypothetical protein
LDAARAAAQSWPDNNRWFAARWSERPKSRKRPGRHPRALATVSDSSSGPINTATDEIVQRAITVALRRAVQIDRTTDLLLALGKHVQADRLARRAQQIREAVA